ncbi:MAG: hypothetical protein R6V56_08355 [Lentisphaeria bacterium]
MAIKLVVFGLNSLRGVGRVFALFTEWFEGGLPCYTIVQDWIMRFGLYKLSKPPQQRNDWVYVLDHTINFGTKKCFLVLGITLEKLRKKAFSIAHQDMEVLAVRIEESATGESVRRTLEQVSAQTGAPAQIVSDGGRNIKRGIADFKQNREGVRETYDITHHAALLIERHLTNDENWKLLLKNIRETKRGVVHTCIAFLAPPKPRDKCRWLNLQTHLDWADKMLRFEKQPMPAEQREKYDARMGWLKDFKPQLREWRTMLNMLEAAKYEIKTYGLRRDSRKYVDNALSQFRTSTRRLRTLRKEILQYVEQQTDGIQKDETFLGCSDIIESVIGKYKSFSAKTPMKEVGKAVLTIPVFTSEVTPQEVKEAMEQVSTRDLKNWLELNIGSTLFAKRKRAFNAVCNKSSVKKIPKKWSKAANF